MGNYGTKKYIGGGLRIIECRCPKCSKEHKRRMPWVGPLPKKKVPKFCDEHRKMARDAAEEYIYYG